MAMKGFLEPDMICEDPFDSIDDLLDFPNDDDGDLAMVESWENSCALAPAAAPPVVPAECGGVSGGVDGRSIAVSGDVISSEADALCLYDEIDTANLEWLSNFFADSEINLEFIPAAASPNPNSTLTGAGATVTSSSSPCSSSSSSSAAAGGGHPATTPVPGKARSKRPRVPSSSARTFIPPSSPTSVSSPAAGKKPKYDGEAPPSSPRRCSHCDVQKTPQWRAGPMGPKTLCNACGVRYKSGRLFPEYRPAVSPTFTPAVHSNSHRKVVEMRLRFTEPAGKIRAGTVAAKNCDLVEYIRSRG